MLRISVTGSDGDEVTLRLEGELRGPWVDEVRQSCDDFLARGGKLTLELSQVSFVDRAAIDLLKSLEARNVVLKDGSPFVNEALTR